MRSMADPATRQELLDRLGHLRPDAPRRFGTMTPATMIAHLTDQMTHTLGDVSTTPVYGFLRLAPVRWLSIYVVPWPKGKVKGPKEAFVTQPTTWDADVARLRGLVERFGACDLGAPFPPHILFGRMSGKDWGVFCYKHFNHHFEQFGV